MLQKVYTYEIIYLKLSIYTYTNYNKLMNKGEEV